MAAHSAPWACRELDITEVNRIDLARDPLNAEVMDQGYVCVNASARDDLARSSDA